MKRLTVTNFLVTVGGEQHSGWLPENAVEPLPIPVREIVFDFELEGTVGGYIFKFYSRCGEMIGDDWYQYLEDALIEVQQRFGIPLDAWHEDKP